MMIIDRESSLLAIVEPLSYVKASILEHSVPPTPPLCNLP